MSNFYLLEKDQKCILGLNFINSTTRKHTNNEVSRKLKNIILSIIFAVLTHFKLFQFSEKCYRVGRYESLFIFFLKGYKNCRGLHTKKQDPSVGLVETGFF